MHANGVSSPAFWYAHGFGDSVFPLPHGTKRTNLEGWPSWQGSEAGFPKGAGVALRTGPFPVIDCDIDDPRLAQRVKRVLHDLMPHAPIRERANSSRFAVLTRLEGEPFPKPKALAFTGGRIEVLAHGQYAHVAGIHDSGAELCWDTPPDAESLPHVTKQTIHATMKALSSVVKAPWNDDEEAVFQIHAVPSAPMEHFSTEECLSMAESLDMDTPGKEDWFKKLCAIKSAGLGYAVARKLSSTSPRFNVGQPFDEVWASIKLDGAGIHAGSLYAMAREAGWIPPHARKPDPGVAFEPIRTLVSFSDLMTEHNLRPVTWAMEPYLPRGELVEIHGPHGTYKSTIAYSIVMCVATGERFAGHKVQHGKAAFISMEDPLQTLAHRARSWLTREGFEDKSRKQREGLLDLNMAVLGRNESRNLALVKVAYGEPKEAKEAVDELVSLLRGYVLVVFETSARLAEGPEDNPTLARLAFALERIASETGACVLVVRHVPKDVARGGVLDSYGGRGGGALADACRGVLSVDMVSDERMSAVRVVHTKAHALGVRGDDLLVKPMIGVAGLFLDTMETIDVAGEVERYVLAYLKEHGDEGATWDKIRGTARRGKGQRERREELRKALDALVEKGSVRFEKAKNGGRFFSNPGNPGTNPGTSD